MAVDIGALRRGTKRVAAKVVFGLPQQPRDALRNLAYLVRRDTSQYGEQALLAGHLPPTGTYLEIGAYLPIALNNTWALRRRGWRGWSVDADPAYERQWKLFRRRDTFIVSAVVPDAGTTETTLFLVDAGYGVRSSLLRDEVTPWATPGADGVRARTVPAVGVDELIDRFCRRFGNTPTLLHLDCEGLDAALFDAMIGRVPPERWPPFALIEDRAGDLVACHPSWPYAEIGRAGISVLLRRTGPLVTATT